MTDVGGESRSQEDRDRLVTDLTAAAHRIGLHLEDVDFVLTPDGRPVIWATFGSNQNDQKGSRENWKQPRWRLGAPKRDDA